MGWYSPCVMTVFFLAGFVFLGTAPFHCRQPLGMVRMLVLSSLTGRAFLNDLLPLRLVGFWRLRELGSRGRRFCREGWMSWAPRLVAMIGKGMSRLCISLFLWLSSCVEVCKGGVFSVLR